MTSELPSRRSPMQIEGALAYGIRHLSDPSALQQFQTDFQLYIDQNAHCLHAALAFPEHHDEPTRLHIVLWYKDNAEIDAVSIPPCTLLSLSSKAFGQPREGDGSDDDLSDGLFYTFSKRSDRNRENKRKVSVNKAVQEERGCKLLEGYLRPPAKADAATAAFSLPMIGIFRRAVQPGLRLELGKSFRPVCDIWHERLPGILGAMVFADPQHENVVHDVRIFANKASYDAHVDKSNPDLVKAMNHWFSHYDRSVPHKGIMVAEDTSDPATQTSSIKEMPVQVNFFIFHYGQGNCMGKVLGSDASRSPFLP